MIPTSERFLAGMFLIAALLIAGCGGKVATIHHPGALNSFDDNAYEVLYEAQAAINEAKAKLPTLPAAAPVLRKAIDAYNAANDAWQLYHAQAAGAPTQGSVDSLIVNVAASVSELLKAFGLSLKPSPPATPGARLPLMPEFLAFGRWGGLNGQYC